MESSDRPNLVIWLMRPFGLFGLLLVFCVSTLGSGQTPAASRAKRPAESAGPAKRVLPETADIRLGVDEEGCKDSALLPRMPKCSIIQCDKKTDGTVEIQVGASQDGVAQVEAMDGDGEVIYYLCPSQVTSASIVKQAEAALLKSGYKLVYSGKDDDDLPLVTVFKDTDWVQISTYPYNEYSAYVFTAITVPAESQSNVEALTEEMTRSGRVELSGLSFNGDELASDSDKELAEIAAFLVRQPRWKIRVEGHGTNREVSSKRASAVASWLLEHGIEKTRLSIQGFGPEKPAESGKSTNRIELVRF